MATSTLTSWSETNLESTHCGSENSRRCSQSRIGEARVLEVLKSGYSLRRLALGGKNLTVMRDAASKSACSAAYAKGEEEVHEC